MKRFRPRGGTTESSKASKSVGKVTLMRRVSFVRAVILYLFLEWLVLCIGVNIIHQHQWPVKVAKRR